MFQYLTVFQYPWLSFPHIQFIHGLDDQTASDAFERFQRIAQWLIGLSYPDPGTYISAGQAEYFYSQVMYSIWETPQKMAYHEQRANQIVSILVYDENYFPVAFPN